MGWTRFGGSRTEHGPMHRCNERGLWKGRGWWSKAADGGAAHVVGGVSGPLGSRRCLQGVWHMREIRWWNQTEEKGTCAQGEKVQADLPLLPLLNEIAHKSVCLVKVVCGPLQISLLQISLSTCLAI